VGRAPPHLLQLSVLAPWHIPSEKSMDFANGCAKEPAQLSRAREHLVQFIVAGMMIDLPQTKEERGAV
jgi:hypothetical protein